MFIDALFIIARNWKQPRCLSVNKQTRQDKWSAFIQCNIIQLVNDIIKFPDKWKALEKKIILYGYQYGGSTRNQNPIYHMAKLYHSKEISILTRYLHDGIDHSAVCSTPRNQAWCPTAMSWGRKIRCTWKESIFNHKVKLYYLHRNGCNWGVARWLSYALDENIFKAPSRLKVCF